MLRSSWRVPRWRSTVFATYKPDARWAFTVAARYSGRQYSNLDNSDVITANHINEATNYRMLDRQMWT